MYSQAGYLVSRELAVDQLGDCEKLYLNCSCRLYDNGEGQKGYYVGWCVENHRIKEIDEDGNNFWT